MTKPTRQVEIDIYLTIHCQTLRLNPSLFCAQSQIAPICVSHTELHLIATVAKLPPLYKPNLQCYITGTVTAGCASIQICVRCRYHVYVLDCLLSLPCTARKRDLLAAMQGHTLQHAFLEGHYR